jgi:hypothetical protein
VLLVTFSFGAQVASSNISSHITAHRDSISKIFGNFAQAIFSDSTQAIFGDSAQTIFGDFAQAIFGNWDGWSLLKA